MKTKFILLLTLLIVLPGAIFFSPLTANAWTDWGNSGEGVTQSALDDSTAALRDDLVAGPASATDEALTIYDGITGKIVKNSDSLLTTSSAGAANSGDVPKLDGTGKIDISMIPATGSGSTTINMPIELTIFIQKNKKDNIDNVHGGIISIQTAETLSNGDDITATTGITKVLFVVNASSDSAGTITITGTSVNRRTGVETPSDTDDIIVANTSIDNSFNDANGNTVHLFGQSYITSKWFKGSFTVSTADVNWTDVDIYQIAFEQFNDEPNITLTGFDTTFNLTHTDAYYDEYLYKVGVVGSVASIDTIFAHHLSAADSEVRQYRMPLGNFSVTIDGSSEGVFQDIFLGPTTKEYFESFTSKIWGTEQQEVSATIVGGSDTEVQFNDSDTLSGDTGFTYVKADSALTVGSITTIDSSSIPAIELTAAGSIADLSYAGTTTILTAGYTTAIGDVVYLAVADGRLELTDKDVEATTGDIGVYVALEVGNDGDPILCLIEGWMRDDSSYNFTVGATVWIGDAGVPTTTESTTTGDFLRALGHAFNADVFYFNPDYVWVEIP